MLLITVYTTAVLLKDYKAKQCIDRVDRSHCNNRDYARNARTLYNCTLNFCKSFTRPKSVVDVPIHNITPLTYCSLHISTKFVLNIPQLLFFKILPLYKIVNSIITTLHCWLYHVYTCRSRLPLTLLNFLQICIAASWLLWQQLLKP